MTIEQAWASLEVSLSQMKKGCCVVVSPHALAIVLEERRAKEIQGEENEQKRIQ
jgi:hypothetical protein